MRQVLGRSMYPRLKPGQLLVISLRVRTLRPGQVVVVRHRGKEKVKRIERIDGERIFVIGDNLSQSTDSRHFGWLDKRSIVGRVVWPHISNH